MERGKAELRAATQAWRVAKVGLEVAKVIDTPTLRNMVRDETRMVYRTVLPRIALSFVITLCVCVLC